MAVSESTAAHEDANTLQIGDLVLHVRQERGIVRKVEQWSESRISGSFKPLQIHHINGNVSSSGGGGSISTDVRRWMRLYVDIGNGRERVHKVPESFAAREGHTVIANYLQRGKTLSLIKLANPHTGGWYKSGYEVSEITGKGILRNLFFLLALLSIGCIMLAVHDWFIGPRARPLTMETMTRFLGPLGFLSAMTATFVALGFITTSKLYRNRKQIEDFIRSIERS